MATAQRSDQASELRREVSQLLNGGRDNKEHGLVWETQTVPSLRLTLKALLSVQPFPSQRPLQPDALKCLLELACS